MKFTREQRARFSIVNGPIYSNGCNHAKEDYIASFVAIRTINWKPKLFRYDLHVWMQRGVQNVCLRYGNQLEEYISAGSLIEFIKAACFHRSAAPDYWGALQILAGTGSLEWKPKPQKKGQ